MTNCPIPLPCPFCDGTKGNERSDAADEIEQLNIELAHREGELVDAELAIARLQNEARKAAAMRKELKAVTAAMDDVTINNTRTLLEAVQELRAKVVRLEAALEAARE